MKRLLKSFLSLFVILGISLPIYSNPLVYRVGDDLDSVADRGATTDQVITVGGLITSGTLTSGGLVVDTDTIFVDSGNNRVGIGTTGPEEALTLGDGTTTPKFRIWGEAVSTGGPRYLDMYIGDWGELYYVGDISRVIYNIKLKLTDNIVTVYGDDNDYSIGYNSTDDTLQFLNGVNIGTDVRMVIDSDGNVGIGTTDPAQALDLVGSLKLEDTISSTTGVIYKGGDRFIHNFQHPTGNTAVPIGRNTFIGIDAGNFTMGSTATDIKHGSRNTAIGYQALYSNTIGYDNLAIGYQALLANTTGYQNFALGYMALNTNTIGLQNYAMGTYSLRFNTIGSLNTAIGYATGYYNQTGDYNVIIGSRAGGTGAGSVNSFDRDTFIGYRSGHNITTGSNNVFLGFESGYNQTSTSDLLIIDNQDRGTANQELLETLIYGTFAADPASQSLRINAGELEIADAGTLASESLQDGNFASFVKWTDANDFNEGTGNYVYLHSTGAGTLTQANADLTIKGINSRWYKFVYTVSSVTENGTLAATITTAFGESAVTLTVNANATYTVYFKSDSSASTADFVISATSTDAGDTFTLDDLSLKEIIGGDLIVNGIITGGGTAGIKVLSDGKVGIGTTAPITPLEIPGSTTNSSAKFGGFEIQSYAVNNAWLTDNLYFDGTGFKRRATGYGSIFYFAAGTFRIATTPSGSGGSYVTPTNRFIVDNSGNVAIGGAPVSIGDFTGASMVVETGGNVGIGTTNPDVKLVVVGDMDVGDGGSNAIIDFLGTTGRFRIGGSNFFAASVAQVTFRRDRYLFQNLANEIMLIVDFGGNVGIGTTDPDQKLEVIGSASFGDDATNNATFATDGELTLIGTARVIKHLHFVPELGKGQSAPTIRYTEDPFVSYTYAINDDSHMTREVPQDMDYTVASIVKIHWYTTDATADGVDEVRWAVQWASRAIGEDITTGDTTGNSGDIVCSAVNIVIETTTVTIPADSIAAGDMLGIHIQRVALGDGTDPSASSIHVLDVELEYTSNKLGEAT